MAEETQYTANTGTTNIAIANSNLDGTGVMNTLVIGAANGTLVKTLCVKATGNTTEGMIRLFVDDGTRTINRLIREIWIPPITVSSINPSFELSVDLDFTLKAGYIMQVSTEKAESFNVIAEGLNWAYYATSVRQDTTIYNANYGSAILSGGGTPFVIYTAGLAADYKGSSINSIVIKGTLGVTPGLLQLFIVNSNTGSSFLIKEKIVPTVGISGTDQAFEWATEFENNFDLQANFQIVAVTNSTPNVFNAQVDGNDWSYVA
jgi:uncharacterized protein